MYPSERIDDKISKDTAAQLGQKLDIVESVIRFQFKTANEATKKFTSIELTDLGVLKATHSKLKRKKVTLYNKLQYQENLLTNTNTEKKITTITKTIVSVKEDIELVSTKLTTYEN